MTSSSSSASSEGGDDFFRDLVHPSGQFLLGIALPWGLVALAVEWFRFRYWTASRTSEASLEALRRGRELGLWRSLVEHPVQLLDVLWGELLVGTGLAVCMVVGLRLMRHALARGLLFAGIQMVAMSYGVIALINANFLRHTGLLFDANVLGFLVSSPKFVLMTILGESGTSLFAVVVAVAVTTLAPWLMGRLWRIAGWPAETPGGESPAHRIAAIAGPIVVVAGLASPGWSDVPAHVSQNAVRRTLQWRGVEAEPTDDWAPSPAPPIWAKLRLPDRTKPPLADVSSGRDEGETSPPNIVIILAESVRPEDTSLYRPDSNDTTPFLEQLGRESVVFERAYTPITETWKALYAGLCGIRPEWSLLNRETSDDLAPATCLPEMLEAHDYETAFVKTTHWPDGVDLGAYGFERLLGPVHATGLEETEVLSKDFVHSNYLGYEDRSMLELTRLWLEENPDAPLMATYVNATTHSPYTVEKREGANLLDRSARELRSDYDETLRYADGFIRDLVAQFKEAGRYDNTIFVVIGDHGEGFGEHGLYKHAGGVYEEAIRVPFLVHDGRRPEGRRIDEPVSHLDLLPTLVEMIGGHIDGADYEGVDALGSIPERTLFTHGWFEGRAMAAIRGDSKYIRHFDARPDAFYNLDRDPEERQPLELEPEERRRWRRAIERVRRDNHRFYRAYRQGAFRQRRFDEAPPTDLDLDLRLQPGLRLTGATLPVDLQKGRRERFEFVFEVTPRLEGPPNDLRLRLHVRNLVEDETEVEVTEPFPVWSDPAAVPTDRRATIGRTIAFEMPIELRHITLTLERRRDDGTWHEMMALPRVPITPITPWLEATDLPPGMIEE